MSHDIEIAAFTPQTTADQIAEENGYLDVPIGTHILVCSGLIKPPERKYYEVIVAGRGATYESLAATVGFHLESNPAAKISDNFVLPPLVPSQVNAWLNGSKDGEKGIGFHANKFIHFLERIGFDWPSGSAIPAEACRTANWRGRRVRATVVAGESYYDQQTGQQKAGRNKIKLFSFERVEQGAPPPPKYGQQTFVDTSPPRGPGAGPYGTPPARGRGQHATSPPQSQGYHVPKNTQGLEAY